ncbi:MAG: hypothetical protein QXZ68_03585 [Candidatus Bathyarchaeia archaeon]
MLKGKALTLTFLIAFSIILALNMFCLENVKAENTFTIEWVNHKVEVFQDGSILINDTLKVAGTPPSNFLIGLPHQYGAHLLGCTAHPLNNPMQRYNVLVNVPLGGRLGFYGVSVNLNPPPEGGIFSVYFVLSQNLLTQDMANTSLFTLNFPAFPSLTVHVSSCNASLVLPADAKYISGTVPAYNYATNVMLNPFTYEPANVTFLLTTEDIQLFTVEEFKREISIYANGEITVSDAYYIKNRSPKEMSSMEVALLPNASDVTVEDEFGRKGEKPTVVDKPTGSFYKVKFTFAGRLLALKSGEAARFIVRYKVPSSLIVKGEKSSEFALQMFQNVRYYIKEAWITFTFPEGARIVGLSCESNTPDVTYGTVREIFQEKITLHTRGVLLLDSLTVKASYTYSFLWLSFRPTLWAWALATFACAIVAVWKRPKAPTVAVEVAVPTVAVKLTAETLRSFVNSYEEKKRIIAELRSLEVAVSRGKIPRRRYKVQRKTLETRLATLDRNLSELRLKIRSAGGRYADLMHQLEVAETEVKEVEEDIRSIEARHKRGELTLEAYRRLLGGYQRRKEKAETTINGILLRLREEAN